VAIPAAAISISGAHDPPSIKMQRMNAPSLPHHPRKLPKKHDLLIPKKKEKKEKKLPDGIKLLLCTISSPNL
jgi:hypothetical protein